MGKNNSNIDFSEKDESPYLKYLKEGTKKFYENVKMTGGYCKNMSKYGIFQFVSIRYPE